MRDFRVLLLSGAGLAGALAAGACATEAQEPGVSSVGPATALTSDSGTETVSDTSTGTETSTETSTGTATATSGGVTTTTNTSGATDDDASVSTATTMPVPLGGTLNTTGGASTTTSAVSTTDGAASTETTGVSATTSTTATTATTATSGGNTVSGTGGMGGMTSVAVVNTTGGGPCTAEPATAPVPLEPNDGWVDCSTNDVGIQGEFFTYSDGNGSTITPSGFSNAGDEICVEGTAGQIVGGDNSTWGAGVGMNLNQEEPEASVGEWDADAMGISGFRFNISELPPSGLRFVIQSGGTDYCVPVTEAGAQTVRFSDTAEACWSAGGGPPDPATLEAVKWQITTVSSAEHEFGFCITQLAAIP